MKRIGQWLAVPLALCAASTPSLAQWKYSSFPDPNAGVMLRLASVESSGWKGTLLIRMLPEGTVNVAFGVPATIVCSSPCKVRARLNGSDDGQRDARYPGSQRDMLFFSPGTLPFAKIRQASTIEIEVETKEYGWRVLSFDVRGFNIDRLNAGS
jgi:hypothetical protein